MSALARAFLPVALVVLAPGHCRAQQDHEHMHHAGMMMSGMYGPYPMSREASGTSWQPDSTPHQGLHLMRGDWMLMAHGFVDGVYDRQGGPRGDDKAFSTSMLMLMAQRPLWEGTFGLRAMASLDPAMGADGYPLLLQTGETADGRTPLVDRQHPHNLFMELAVAFSRRLGEGGSVYGYFGFPGEPALGPPNFMHRFSALDNPAAPLTHHWLDSTHVSNGVATLGYGRGDWKLEGSAFNGREPDEKRWQINSPRFDSFSARVSYNPTEDWALQASYGHLLRPEELEPGTGQKRFTASASANQRLAGGLLQATFAYGKLMNAPGNSLDGFLLEAALRLRETHTFFARAERVDKDELFLAGSPLAGSPFTVNDLSAGYLYDFARWRRSQWGLGGLASVPVLPAGPRGAYGSAPFSFMVFARVKLI